MAYNPTVWATGDIITAEKLNKMEQGIAGADSNVYTFTQAAGADEYAATSAEDAVKILSDIANNKTFMVKVKLYSEEAASVPALVGSYGPYDGNDNKLSLDVLSGIIKPAGMEGIPYYDESAAVFKWNIYGE